MRSTLIVSSFLAVTFAWAAQGRAQESQPSPKLKAQSPRTYYKTAANYRLHLVGRMLNEPEPLAFSIVLHWLGDEASADILKILNNKTPTVAAEQQKILDMIHTSFEAPQFILDAPNRTPSAALTLLDSIAATATDPSVKGRVVTERAFALYSMTMPLHSVQVDSTKPPPAHPPVLISPK